MTTAELNKPLPVPAKPDFTKPFWDGAKRGELVIPRCKHCDRFMFFPREVCPNCLAINDIEWVKVSGRGRLHAFTIVHQPAHPAFGEDAPYAYCVIQLDEGVRMISNVVDCSVDDLECDMPVEAVFDEVSPEWTLVKFKPA
jgi:hypothetical protein